MYHPSETPRTARRQTEALPGRDPEENARRALDRVRRTLTAFRPGLPLDAAALRAALTCALPQPDDEAERQFALGWLHWLDGDFAQAEPLLMKAVELSQTATAQHAESAYWLARVRLRLERTDAVGGFETVLRQLGGSPQATAWFVDLLWRAGRVDRAEQVWKSVRGNKRVVGCPEGAVLEARSLLRRGEVGGAVKALVEAQPVNGVVWVERLLLLAWAEVAQNRRDKAQEFLKRVEGLPYPRAVLETWRHAVERDGPAGHQAEEFVPAILRDLGRGYRAAGEGRIAEAVEAFRAARDQPVASAFARYSIARLGHESFSDVLAAHPGLFLALRCRVWLALERFRLRQGSPGEWLETLKREGRLGFIPGRVVEHFRRLALVLHQPRAAEELRHLVHEGQQTEAPVRRNLFRVALESARRLPVALARDLLSEWAARDWLATETVLSQSLRRQSLRWTILETEAGEKAVDLLRNEPLLQAAAELWQAAGEVAADETWRERVRGLRSSPKLRPLAQALLLHEAARRGDVAAVVSLLEEVDAWRGFRTAPPGFVLRAVASVAHGQPAHAGLRRALERWLPLWDRTALGQSGAVLSAYAGLATAPASRSEAPAGVPLVAWLLHQAARALGRDDAVEALACMRRAHEADSDWASVAGASVVRDALPELERRAYAQTLAAALSVGDAAPIPAHLLTDLVDLLRELPDADGAPVRDHLAAILTRPQLVPRLAHHLALIELRSAQTLEEKEEIAAAEPHWRRSWTAWIRFLAAPPESGRTAVPDAARLIFDWLLAGHRVSISDLLARNAVDAARRHWALVKELPALTRGQSEALGDDLSGRIERFRDDLASEYLVRTREAMRYGEIPEGWRADYEKGLSQLRRLLSLDRDNVRLLTALVEVCSDWFLDLYNAEDRARLTEQVARFVPFAQQLSRLAEGRPGDLAARAALSEFFKFRGFVAAERTEKVSMYQEALRLNPANDNVRELLKELGVDPQVGEPA